MRAPSSWLWDPTDFCGFTDSPGGGALHPSLQPSAGGAVTGMLEVEGSEYVCDWMTVEGGPDDITTGTRPLPVATELGDGDVRRQTAA